MPKGWCPENKTLEGSNSVHVTVYTDYEDLEEAKKDLKKGDHNFVIKHTSTFGENPIAHFDKMDKKLEGFAGFIKGKLGGVSGRWYHTKMLDNAPYPLVVYLDLDAVPCNAEGLMHLYGSIEFADVGVSLAMGAGMVVHGDHRKLHPPGLTKDEVEEWSEFQERNAGVIALNRKFNTGRKIAFDWKKAFERHIETRAPVKGDQPSFREALFMNRNNMREVLFRDDQVCRYGEAGSHVWPCRPIGFGGCWVNHLQHPTEQTQPTWPPNLYGFLGV